MNRAVSSILIPLLLVSQSLFSVPHLHAGSSIAEADEHAARPHIHLHDTHEHHGHEAPSSTGEQVPDHDSDAVYSSDDQLLNDGKVTKVVKAEMATLCSIVDDSTANAALSELWSLFDTPPVLRPRCAIYLQILSIRC